MTVGSALKWTVLLAIPTLLITLLVMSLTTMVAASSHSVRCDRQTSLYGADSPQAHAACS